jgi:lysophospholipid acyltransferase (LPLAT)-like uncharacterized protein
MSTLDYRAVFYDRSVDPALDIGPPRIYIFWHENILAPLYQRGHCNLVMLLSQHPDADILERVAFYFGFECVRGSTQRGGTRAIWEMAHRGRYQHLTMTPDGPRGPRRRLAPGPIYLASRMQLPLVVMGFGYDRPWRMKSWDRFAVPRPFSRARAVIGPPLMLPRDLSRDAIERCGQHVEQLLNDFTTEAEAWAAAGSRKAGEIFIVPRSAPAPVSARNNANFAPHHPATPARAA